MHTTCFDQHWSYSGVTKIADETAVLPSVGSIFGICPRLCACVSYGDGQFLLLSFVAVMNVYLYLYTQNKLKNTYVKQRISHFVKNID
jgi:hypothetical protein